MSDAFEFDVFLSHSSSDKPAARELAKRLREDGLRVWFDEWQIQPGDMIGLKIEEGLEKSRTLVLVMSRRAFASEWVSLERQTAMFRDPTNAKRRFIPLRLDDTEIRDTLRQFAYIDWRKPTPDQYERLRRACHTTEVAAPRDPIQNVSPVMIGETHKSEVVWVAVAPDGRRAISAHHDWLLRVWDLESGKLTTSLKGHSDSVRGVAMTADGRTAISGSYDRTVRTWNLESGLSETLSGHTDGVTRVAVTPDGRLAASASYDRTVRLWNLETRRCSAVLKGHTGAVHGVALSPDGSLVASASVDRTVRIWAAESGEPLYTLRGHSERVVSVAFSRKDQVVSSSHDQTLRLWDLKTGRLGATIEGHTDVVWGIALTADGHWAISGSWDKTVRVWGLADLKPVAILTGHRGHVSGVAVTPDGSRVIAGAADGTLLWWDLTKIKPQALLQETSYYTNAKVLLVGDSGAGKSGLAQRLAKGEFIPTISTDGAWATQLPLPYEIGTTESEREIWLWDFAGQADYRLIHQLYMDETSLAVLVFNPQSENPFEGIGQWDRDLSRAARRPFQKILVAGRCDRGGLMVSRSLLEKLCRERGFVEYLETSAQTGEGCGDLQEAIARNIRWEDVPWTSSPQIFRRLREEILALRDQGWSLFRMVELKQQLEMRLPADPFEIEDLRSVVGLLAGPGVVWRLDFGDFVLIQPALINTYAAAVIRSVRAHTEEIGCIPEENVLAGEIDYQNMKRLPQAEEEIVLRAMHQMFVDRGLCLRERTDHGIILVFPSYFKRERPELDEHPAVFVSYRFNGAFEDIYATLVVRLSHTTSFDKDQLWRFAADFRTPGGKRAGLKMARKGEGAAEMVVYFEAGIPDDTKVTFIRYIHEHLQVKATDVIRLRHYVCPHCDTPVENRKTAQDRLLRGEQDILCVNCEKRVLLWDLIEKKFASQESQERVRELEERSRASIDNESRELILIGDAFAIAGEAGQIFRPTPNSDWGIDGEVEFKDYAGKASGARVYLQLKSGDSHLSKRKNDGAEIFKIKHQRHAEYWQQQAYQVMLVIRTSDGFVRWMNVTEHLQRQRKVVKQIVFEGEPFTAKNLLRMRDRLLGPPPC